MKVNLPNSKANKPIDNNKKPVNLAVTKERKYFIDSKETDVANLETALMEKIAGKAEPVIILHIDKDLVYQDFIDVMQIGDRLKCKMVCATAPSNGK